MPEMDGLQTLAAIRKQYPLLPVIMFSTLTQRGATTTIEALTLGANDYVTKPFRLAVLQARIRAQLRSHEHSEGAVFRLGPYEFRPAAKVLVDSSGRKVRLTEKETNILKYLYRAGEKSVAREELLAEVWGYNSNVTTHTLETHIYRLRQKVERDPSNAQILVTEAGGYKLIP
jgi:DNA-binding response OmpR family regulator